MLFLESHHLLDLAEASSNTIHVLSSEGFVFHSHCKIWFFRVHVEVVGLHSVILICRSEQGGVLEGSFRSLSNRFSSHWVVAVQKGIPGVVL
jgi:hypothetical protein